MELDMYMYMYMRMGPRGLGALFDPSVRVDAVGRDLCTVGREVGKQRMYPGSEFFFLFFFSSSLSPHMG